MNCLQGNLRNFLQKRPQNENAKEARKAENDALSGVESLQDNECYDSRTREKRAINEECLDSNINEHSSEDYEDTLTFVNVCPIPEDEDYEDVFTVVSSETRQRTKSFETNLNPAYGSSKDCLSVKEVAITVSTERVVEDTSNSDYCDIIAVNDLKEEATDDLINNDAYFKSAEYSKQASDATDVTVKPCAAQLEERSIASCSKLDAGVSTLTNSETVHEYDYPNLAKKTQGTCSHVQTNTWSAAVVHSYDYTENVVENLLLLPHVNNFHKHQDESASSAILNRGSDTISKCNHNSNSENERKKLPSVEGSLTDHEPTCAIVETTTSKGAISNDVDIEEDESDYTFDKLCQFPSTKRAVDDTLNSDTTQHDYIQIHIQNSTGTVKDESDNEDDDYTFDRLSECVYVDSEQLLLQTEGAEAVLSSVDAVHYSRLSPVTFWEGEWSQEDLAKANIVYAAVNKVTKKPKLVTLDKKLGSLV